MTRLTRHVCDTPVELAPASDCKTVTDTSQLVRPNDDIISTNLIAGCLLLTVLMFR